MNLLDWLTLVSYIALNVDIVLQIKRIYRRKSSDDLSLVGMTIRYIAIIIIIVKFAAVGDISLIIGQSIAVVTFGTYFTLALMYYRRRKHQNRQIHRRHSRTAVH